MRASRRVLLLTWLVGVLAAATVLAIAEAVAVLVSPASSPLAAVGSWVIDLVPPWVKDTAIALFGTGDKAALLVGLALMLVILALLLGLAEYRRPPLGIVGLVLVGLVATIAVTTRAEATAIWALPTVLGMIGGVVVLRVGTMRLRRWEESRSRPSRARQAAGVDRRSFLYLVAGTAAGAAIVGVGARAMNATSTAVNALREALTLPAPADPAAAVPAGADLGIPGVAPIVTPNADFYRIDTALQVPVIDAAGWKLRITGMVENEVEIGFEELLALPMTERIITIACVSNDVGGDLIGNARWLGYPLRDLLARAKPRAGADMVLSRSIDGFTAGTPLAVLLEKDRDSLLAIGMNGEPLPLEHGFPARMIVPGLFGYVSATKWVTELKLTRFADETAYWTDRGWSALGPVKMGSRIDVPAYASEFAPGPVTIAGVAWSQHTGIAGVEVRVSQNDDGEWMPATLATAISADTWVQWSIPWTATSGVHRIEVRATDTTGFTQGAERVPVAPNGAEGYHTITVGVS